MKKLICLLLITISLLSIFAGCSSKDTIEISGKVPEGAIYMSIDNTAHLEGQEIPETKAGDVFQYSDYRFGFERVYNKEKNMWIYDQEYKGKWSVYVFDTSKTEYKEIPSVINGLPVKITDDIYKDCKNIKK